MLIGLISVVVIFVVGIMMYVGVVHKGEYDYSKWFEGGKND